LLLVKLDSLTWRELHDYSNREKWKLELGLWIKGYGLGCRMHDTRCRMINQENRDSWKLIETRDSWRFVEIGIRELDYGVRDIKR